MTAFLRNTLLAAAALSSLSGPALADQTITSCAKTTLNDLWSGRCCDAGSSDCRDGGRRRQFDNSGRGDNGGGHNGGRGDNGGGNNGGTAGKA